MGKSVSLHILSFLYVSVKHWVNQCQVLFKGLNTKCRPEALPNSLTVSPTETQGCVQEQMPMYPHCQIFNLCFLHEGFFSPSCASKVFVLTLAFLLFQEQGNTKQVI